MLTRFFMFFFFFFNDTATTEIYTLSLHDALPILEEELVPVLEQDEHRCRQAEQDAARGEGVRRDRKSTRLNSSHGYISYAVFCLKKKTSGRKPSAALQHHLDEMARSSESAAVCTW